VNAASLAGDPQFTITSTGGNCANLSPGFNCTIVLQFAPTATGPHTATLTIPTSNAGTFSVPVSGTGQ
jgi:hypothetical protein